MTAFHLDIARQKQRPPLVHPDHRGIVADVDQEILVPCGGKNLPDPVDQGELPHLSHAFPASWRSPSHAPPSTDFNCLAACAISSAATIAEITAAASAPASRTSRAFFPLT